MEEAVTRILTAWGPAGAVILVLLWAYRSLQEKYDALVASVLKDGRENTAAMRASAEADQRIGNLVETKLGTLDARSSANEMRLVRIEDLLAQILHRERDRERP